MRRTFVALVVSVVVALAAPANAKCDPDSPECPQVFGRAIVRGPGLTDPIVLEGDSFWRAVSLVAGYRPYGSAGVEPEDGIPLGPKYTARFIARREGEARRVLTADLYPYAQHPELPGQPRMWFFTEPGQLLPEPYGGEFVSEMGWWHSVTLLRMLVARGLPQASPVPLLPSAPEPLPPLPADGVGAQPVEPTPETWMTLGAIGILIAVGALAGRRGERPRVVPSP